MKPQRALPGQVPPDLRVTEVPPSLGGAQLAPGAGQHLFSLFRAELLAFAAERASVRQKQEVDHA